MFKQARGAALINQQRTLVYPQRAVTSQRLQHSDEYKRYKDIKGLLNLYGEVDGNLGVVKMNREHRFNTLTDVMIKDITRGVDTMNNDYQCHAIYIGTEKGEHWSNGTDFRTLLHLKREDNNARITEYMKQLYHMQTNIAKCNKPLIAVAPGHVFNSGAAYLAACSHPMTTLTAKVAFNETTFGFVPHSGGSYYMSRLKGEFGTFMALTGIPIEGSEAQRMDISRGIVHYPAGYHEEVADHVHTMPFPEFGGADMLERKKSTQDFRTPWQDYVKHRNDERHKIAHHERDLLTNQRLMLHQIDRMRDPEDRIQESTTEANFKYLQYIKNDAQHHEVEGQGYLEFGEDGGNRRNAFIYKNYFKDAMNYITGRIGNSGPKHHGVAVNQQMMIDRCFYSNSIEEIMDNLRRETHPFARECLEAMERNSPQAMQLALKMLRLAKNLDYKGCLQLELNVAFNRIKDADFDLGVQEVIMKPKVKGAKHKKRPDWAPALKESELDAYFQENQHAQTIDLGIVENALLPTKNYYQRFTDQVRLWINQESTTQHKIREIFDIEARNALQEQGIDARDMAITPQIARDHLAAKLAIERVNEIAAERAEQLMTDYKLRTEYFDKIDQEVEKLLHNDGYFYDQVNKNIQQNFQDAYINRLDHIFKKSAEAHNLEKRRMFIRLKKFYFKERILEYGADKQAIHERQFDGLPYQSPHLTEKWDTSFRDQSHPDLVRSPLYLISKAIGRVSLTTPELTRAYLTNPNAREQMTLFTFDKSELESLHRDVIADPGKYEMIFAHQMTEDQKQIRNVSMKKDEWDLGDAKREEIEYWYRYHNGGYCPIDALPWIQEFKAYKEWADRIEHNALNTMRAAISQILLEHEDMESSDGKLKQLWSLVHNYKGKAKTPEPDAGDRLGTKSRSLNDVKKDIRRMLAKHPHFHNLFSDQNLAKNPRVAALMQELESDLLKLVEIVLLDKLGHVDQSTYKKMQKRLAALTNAGMGDTGLSLNMIDQQLQRKNGEALVADAFDLVGPFFAEMVRARMQLEVQKIFTQLDWEEVEGEVLVYYFLNKTFPNFRKNTAFIKYFNFSHDEDIYNMVQSLYPFMDKAFQQKSIMSMIASQDLDYSKGRTIKELEHDSLNQTRQDLNDFNTQLDSIYAAQPKFEQSSDEDRTKFYQFTDIEITYLHHMNEQLSFIYEWLEDQKYEIDYHMTDFDSLKFLAESIKHHDMQLWSTQETETKEHWDQLQEYIVFASDLCVAVENSTKEHRFDAMAFLEDQNSRNRKQQTNFYAAARSERDKYIHRNDKKTVVDRHSLIKSQIDDFNQLQAMTQSSKQLKDHLNSLIQSKPAERRHALIEFLSQHEYVDLELMTEHVENDQYDFLSKPHSVINVPKAVRSAKQHLDSFDTSVDVVSLHQLKQSIKHDSRLKHSEKNNLRMVVDYICDQTKYISNEERKNLSVRDYLDQHHFTSPEAYRLYASDVLKTKLERILGQSQQERPEMIEWQLGETRTMPYEHVDKTRGSRVISDAILMQEKGRLPKQQTDYVFGKEDTIPDTQYNFNLPAAAESQDQDVKIQGLKSEVFDQSKGRQRVGKFDAAGNMSSEEIWSEDLGSEDELKDAKIEYYNAEEEQVAKRLSKIMEGGKYEYNPSLSAQENKKHEALFKKLKKNFDHDKKIVQNLKETYKDEDMINEPEPENYVVYKDGATGRELSDTFRDYHNKEVYRKARESVEMPIQMQPTKNLYEHRILLAMMEPQYDDAYCHGIIEEYMQIRYQHAMLNKAFAEGVRSDNGHIFMKVLREQIITEVGLNQDPQGKDLKYQNIMDEFKHVQFYNLENQYNMQTLNNEHAIGYDRLKERANAKNAEENYTTAHESVFEKLIGEYFLNKRGEYKESNKLLNQLAEIFENRSAKIQGGNAMDHLQRTQNEQMINKQQKPTLQAHNFREMIQLDVAASRAMQDNKPGMSESLRKLSIKETDHPDFQQTQVPEYFELYDVRKPAKQYVDDKLMMVVREAFEVRAKVEQKMTRAELVAFDKVLARYLQKEKLMPRLLRSIEEDYNALHATKSLIHQTEDHLVENDMVQGMKSMHDQRGVNKRVINEDAQFKQLAFMAMMDKKNATYKHTDWRFYDMLFNGESFEEYYKKELDKDAQRPARPINEADYVKKKPWEKDVNKKWQTEEDRVKDLWRDHSVYQEKKKEQQERIQLFYILEQFYEESRNRPSKGSESQKLIKNYFQNPENIHFFDMNKLV